MGRPAVGWRLRERPGYPFAVRFTVGGRRRRAGGGVLVKIVFLDFDGVLNSHLYFAKHAAPNRLLDIPARDHIDPDAVTLLDQLLLRTGAHIVVSSTWRLTRDTSELYRLLVAKGLRHGTVVGKTADLRGAPRGKEIRLWVDTHRPESFVILDDDSDMAEMAPWLVKTSFGDGLQQDHVGRAVAILAEPWRGL